MTLRELRAAIDQENPNNLDKPLKVWLPGSRVAITGTGFICYKDTVLVEGNLEEGSILGT